MNQEDDSGHVPQPPQRTNVRASLTRHTQAPMAPPPPVPPKQPLTTTQDQVEEQHQSPSRGVVASPSTDSVAEAAARLVYKSMQSGSVPTLQSSQNSPPLKSSPGGAFSYTNSNSVSSNGDQGEAAPRPDDQTLQTTPRIPMATHASAVVGTMTAYSTPTKNNSPPNSSSVSAAIIAAATTNPHRPPPPVNANLTKQPYQNPLQHHTNSTSINAGQINSLAVPLPWILLNGEYLAVLHKDPLASDDQQLPPSQPTYYSEIIFVMPVDNRGVRGKLYITNFRLYFKSDESYWLNHNNNVQTNLIIDLPLGLINRIEKIGHQSSKQSTFYGLLITCKNGRRLRFANTQCEKGVRKQIYELLQKYAFPLSYNMNFFAFDFYKHVQQHNDLAASNQQQNGWLVYDCKQEYERMGVGKSAGDWRFTTINQSFKFCETYPRLLVVPATITDDDLRVVGQFRSKHRIPVVTWLKYDSRKNCVALLRSSQPLVGLPPQKRNEKDENYLFTLYKMNTLNSLDKLFIMDARPLVNAVANRTTGGGYENLDNYKECELVFLNIHNIHVMRESLRKIFDMATPVSASFVNNMLQQGAIAAGLAHHGNSAANLQQNAAGVASSAAAGGGGASNQSASNEDDKNFLVNLENSKWLEHIRSVLNGALKIVKHMHGHNASVLVHCSDGWDRTAQLTSIAMLMMDKYYRTIRGFEVLIEKEWLSFGHRFGIRMGHGSDKHADQDRSPIFLQFIDCVWQLMQQNAKVFEFNERLLLTIVNNMYTCQFGTFLYSNEAERERNDCRARTMSLWTYVNSCRSEFKNPVYVEFDGVVECSTSMASLQLWTNYYFQYKEIIDDSSISAVNVNCGNYKQQQQQTNPTGGAASSAILMPPMSSSSKLFGQAFFSQMVSQMKASVRNMNTTPGGATSSLVPGSTVTTGNSGTLIDGSSYASGQQSAEPELVRYKATVPTSADIF